MAERVCSRCGDRFTPPSSAPNQQVCEKAHTKNCAVCQNPFPWDKRKKTCSTICTSKMRAQSMKERPCAICGESFRPTAAIAKVCDRDHKRTCEHCGTEFVVSSAQLKRGLNRLPNTCSSSCATAFGHTDESKQKRVENTRAKHGVDHMFQVESVKAKIKDALDADPTKDYRIGSEGFTKTLQDKYGVANVSSLDEIKAKKVATVIINYGVDNPMKDKTIAESMVTTMLDRYGVARHGQKHITHYDEWTNLEKWLRSLPKKPTAEEAAKYFNVNIGMVKFHRNRDNLHSLFAPSPVIRSKKEQRFVEFLKENFPDINYVRNNRSVIYPKELDFYFPDHNFAVEISPLSTHSSTYKPNQAWGMPPKDPDYHQNKAIACEDKGVELLTIFDWMPWSKTMDMIAHKLQGSSVRIGARKTVAHFIVKAKSPISKRIKDFIDSSHVLGFDGRGTSFYTYLTHGDDGTIVAAAGWGAPRVLSPSARAKNQGQLDGGPLTMELTRLCFAPGFSIPGGASKLLSTFIKRYEGLTNKSIDRLITFSDYDLGHGSVYKSLGFVLDEVSKPQRNYVHPTHEVVSGGDLKAFRVRGMSLHMAGADRLLASLPGYVPVGRVCVCTDGTVHADASCLPSNIDIVLSYGMEEKFDCGYKKWSLTLPATQ